MLGRKQAQRSRALRFPPSCLALSGCSGQNAPSSINQSIPLPLPLSLSHSLFPPLPSPSLSLSVHTLEGGGEDHPFVQIDLLNAFKGLGRPLLFYVKEIFFY